MATIVGTQTITIGSDTDLSFVKSWVPKYANELKKNNTMVKKAAATDGEALLRISHQVTKGIEGHVVSLEIQGVRGTTPAARLVKAQMVMTCETGNAEESALLSEVVEALCTYVPTVMADLMADVLD